MFCEVSFNFETLLNIIAWLPTGATEYNPLIPVILNCYEIECLQNPCGRIPWCGLASGTFEDTFEDTRKAGAN